MQLFHSLARSYVNGFMVFISASVELQSIYAAWLERRSETYDTLSWVPDRATLSQTATRILEGKIEPSLKELDTKYAACVRALYLSLIVRLDGLVAVNELLCGDKELAYLGGVAGRKRILDELEQIVSDTNQLMADTLDYYLYNRYEAREPDPSCP
jgi:hypothetical protein